MAGLKRGWWPLALLTLILIAPELAPHAATDVVGLPYSTQGLLGTDHLGRDVLSRLMHGGRPMVLTSLAAAALGTGAGTLIGLVAAWWRPFVLRPWDAVAAVPGILVLLLVLTAMPNRAGIVFAVALASVPLSARVVHAAAAQVIGKAHVEHAKVRGERTAWILGREVLPLIGTTVLADLGLRFVMAVYLVAAAGFLGLSTMSSDWGLLVVEALPGAALQPVALLAPVVGIAVVAVSANRVADRVGEWA
ncbi:ABC transporter permease [Lentzea flava]|uniref:ABC transporter permease n=1 Tax=Lentzea flava TaxID=103732 RepID=A0ABQ2UFP0_9PSEU|nr:ABC transporter permease [Lentzea flava]